MGIKYVKEFPKCDICGEEAKYDAPTRSGQWGYMCDSCAKKEGANIQIGTTFEKREPKPQSEKTGVVMGLEDTSIEALEEVLFDLANREIECPECGSTHAVEPDAAYVFTCEGCGVKVQCPMPVC